MNPRKRFVLLFALLSLVTVTAHAQYTEGITVRESRDKAWTPAQELAAIELDGPYEAQLVASEPLILDPVEMTWDAKGRCFVADMRDYPLGPPEGQKPLSRIVQLLEPDKDGRYTKSKVFADHIDHVQGLLPYKDGLIATTRTQILFLRDTDGDGVADEIKPLIEGFNPTHSQLQVSAPRWGLDNRVYFNNGLNAAEIYPSASADAKVKVTRCNLRWDPATGKIEPTSGYGQFGGCFDDWGRHFSCSNRNPVMFAVMPYETVMRNPHAGIAQGWEDIAPSGGETRVYPLQLTHTTADAHAGTHTAACGLGVYRGDLMPELRGEIFVCEPTAQAVVRYHVETSGASLKATRIGDHTEFFRSRDEWTRPVNVTTGPDGALYICDIYRRFIDHARYFPESFVKSHDMRAGENEGRIWRVVRKGSKTGGPPVSASGGPPDTEINKTGKLPVTPTGEPPVLRLIEPAPSKVEDLVAWLGHKNAWQRETAQRLLLEKKPEELKGLFPAIQKKTLNLVPEMEKIAKEDATSPMPLRIDMFSEPLRGELEEFTRKNPDKPLTPDLQKKLSTAVGMKSVARDLPSYFMMHWTNLATALIRRNGLEAMRPGEKVSSEIFPLEAEGLDSSSWYLRRYGANYLQSGVNISPMGVRGEYAMLCDGRVTDAGKLATIATRSIKQGDKLNFLYFNDPWMQRAILASSVNKAGAVLAGIVSNKELMKSYAPASADFIRSLASCSAADADAEDFKALLGTLDREKGSLAWWKPAVLQGLGEGLPKSQKKLGAGTLAELTAKPPAEFKDAAAEITTLLAQVDKVMTDAAAPQEQRLAVIPLLVQRTWDKAEPVVRALLADGQPPEIATAALAVLRRFSTEKTAPLLYELLPKASPVARRDIVTLLSSGKTLLDLLQRMDRGEVPKSLIGVEQRWGLNRSANKEVKELAEKLFGTVSSDRAAVIAKYMDVTKMKGDATKGHQVFATICIACHRVRGEGVEVGPDITDVRIKPLDALLTDILDPNRICEPRFMAYQVDTKDGRVISGIVASENSDGVTLKMSGGTTETVARSNIKTMKCLDQSLMPVGLEATINPQQMADLMAFLRGE